MGHDTAGESPDKVGSKGKAAGSHGDPAADGAMRSGGESGGEARAQPQTGDGGSDGPLGHGGQHEIGYHGSGQLGEEETAPGNANAPAKQK